MSLALLTVRVVAPTPRAAIDHPDDIPRPTADITPADFFLCGRLDPDPRGGAFRGAAFLGAALRGAVGFFGVVTVRAVRPPDGLRDPPEARDVDEPPALPAFELRVLVFPAMAPRLVARAPSKPSATRVTARQKLRSKPSTASTDDAFPVLSR
ncbi:hypothetical protein CH263_10160 [Rhodococcus sp. 06-1059B-a]|nr:hypothetical protein CH263_10160 [Rhodococcus sp. 06-1059B-a]